MKSWRKPDVCIGDALFSGKVYTSPGDFKRVERFGFTQHYTICSCLFVLLGRTDSEIFEDSVELQQFFIRIRDELCKNGEILLSPALSYTTKHLHSDVEKEKKEKLPKEYEEDKLKREEEKKGALIYI